MKYHRLHINHFGTLQNQTLEFSDGINVIYGPNESGKSTLHAFLESMLFGMERGRGKAARRDAYSRYFPAEGSSTYGGVLELTRDGTRYTIYRNFQKGPRGYTLMDETHNRQLNLTEEEYRQFLSGLTRPLYRNTLSLGQLQASVSGSLSEQLSNHIVNLNTTGSSSLDIAQARERLKKDRRQLELSYSRQAEQEAKQLEQRIGLLQDEMEQTADHPDFRKMEDESAALNQRIDRMNQRRETLTREIQEDEAYLADSSSGDLTALAEAEKDLTPLMTRRDRYLNRHKGALSTPLRIASLLLALLLLCLGGGGMILGVWFYLKGHALRGGGLAAIGVLAALLCLLTSLRLLQDRSFRRNERRIRDLYRRVWLDAPSEVTDRNLEEFTALLEEMRERHTSLQKNREEEHALTEQLLHAQSQARELPAGREAIRHELWQQDQREEVLRGLLQEKEALSDQLAQNRLLAEEISAVDLAAETIDHLSETAFDSFGHYLQETASELLSQITGGRYTRLLVDDNLNITLERDHTAVSLDGLSCSTLDQVYLSLRVACIRFFWPDEPMPLLLDESFALYDADRIAETLCWLSESYPGQVLLFTCQHREEDILKKCRIEYETISL
ncbi:MAG: AAA family ATPase [Lachnospiraceae bacterium]|nr:AAA family ATPase [Lachnospiraceae bacterium]